MFVFDVVSDLFLTWFRVWFWRGFVFGFGVVSGLVLAWFRVWF